MTPQTAQLLQDVLRLPESERSELAAKIIDSLDPTTDTELDSAWGEEIRRRIEELDSGAVKPVPWAEARRQIMEDVDDAIES
jgi:putative addiction module component (TIGR02574 family)